ncbi:MAG: AMP-binding protein, partial [Deltaproteobacteria bacterium]
MLDPITFPALIAKRALENSSDVFLIDAPTDHSWTYLDIYNRARHWADALRLRGVGPSDHVGTMLLNTPESVAIWLGIAYLGAVEIPGNIDYKGSLLQHYISLSKVKILITIPQCLDNILTTISETNQDLEIISIGSDAMHPDNRITMVSEIAELDVDCQFGDTNTFNLSSTASVMFTSGTTGRSKGVVIPWMQLHESALGWMPIGGKDENGQTHGEFYQSLDPCYYSPFPFHHMASRAPLHLMALLCGRVVLRPAFKTDLFWDEVRKYGCSSTELLGTMALFLFNSLELPEDAKNPMRSVMIVPLIGNYEAFASRFDVRIWTVYNMTELSVPIVSDGFDLVNNKTSGRIRPGYEARIVDGEDFPVAIGETGELIVRSSTPWSLMAGYLDMPEATTETWRNLWFHTGDGFRIDNDGNMYFVDRLKDTIRRRGENITSIELENEVQLIEGVAVAAAIGVPSQVGEEDVKVVATRSPNSKLSEQDLIELLAARLPRFMVPRYVEWVADFPRTPTQKIQKAVLRQGWETP